MDLAIFDVDGTLTATNDVDSECFVEAITEVLGIPRLDTDWSRYEHATDPGIFREVFTERFGNPPGEVQVSAMRDQFIYLLRDRLQTAPERYDEIAGAASALYRLRNEQGWAIAIASGAWRGSACVKLQAAGISPEAFPSVFAEEAISREEIIGLAINRALTRYKQPSFYRIVSIGDGSWDVRAARNLGLAFVGVAEGPDQARLLEEGASHVMRDFSDFDGLLKCLAEALVPGARARS